MTPNITVPMYQRKYNNAIRKLLSDPDIHPANRKLFEEFFQFESYKLKRINALQELDEPTYKTLLCYIVRLRNVNRWFGNKPLADITKDDIQRVYDDLEDGRIVNQRGQPFASRADYYNKIFKSKFFKLIGKDDLARQVIEFAKPHKTEVRFIREQAFRRLARRVREPRNQLLMWLAWDYGENIGAHLQLVPEDFHRQVDPETGEPEYRVNYRSEVLKRSRRPRSELSNHPETVDLLDEILPSIQPGHRIFTFGYAYAKKIIGRAVRRCGAVCEPAGGLVTWKDLRSGMACDLLSKGWTRDEVNARLGHKPSSDEIDKYINFLAIDRRGPKQKVVAYQSRQKEKGRQLVRQQVLPGPQETQAIKEQMAVMKQALMEELRAEFETAGRREVA